MTSERWQEAYDDLLCRIPVFVDKARLAICGLATCVDAYVRLDAAEKLLYVDARTPQGQLGKELLHRAAAGTGGEFRMNWPEGGTWVERNLQISGWGIGGTGAQAAQTLATLGAPALMSLEDRSARQLSVTHPDILVADKSGLVKCGDLPNLGGGKPAHYIFEFTEGKRIGSVVPTRSTRTIVLFADDPLDNDLDFIRESIAAAASAGAGILCGFNGVADQELEMALAEAQALSKKWKDRGLKTIHLELGGYSTQTSRDSVLKTLTPNVTSLGMSFSELRGLCEDSEDPITKAYDVAASCGLSRLCVHADTWALAVTQEDPNRELEALMMGCLLASTRAAAGQASVPQKLPDGARFFKPPLPASKERERWSIVCCPAPYLAAPAATVGLGDTFLAGTLLVLGAEHVKSPRLIGPSSIPVQPLKD
jgi:ADP-dependent phosphofructokinase/glucokinase